MNAISHVFSFLSRALKINQMHAQLVCTMSTLGRFDLHVQQVFILGNLVMKKF